jgi:hypothetical protein
MVRTRAADKDVKYSIVVPAYKEGANIEPLTRQVYDALDKAGMALVSELLIIDDNSPDDVGAACAALQGSGLNVRIIRLNHDYGMRGNTVSFNTAFGLAQGHILAETTPETLLPPDGIRRLLEPHETHPRAFVAMKTYNLTIPGQQAIDTVDWASNAMNCAGLPEWDSAWTQNNVRIVHFGTHQTCSIRKEVFYEMTKGRGFPLFGLPLLDRKTF